MNLRSSMPSPDEATRCRLMERDSDGKPTFVYRKETDIAATFARLKRQQKQAAPANVTPILRKAKP